MQTMAAAPPPPSGKTNKWLKMSSQLKSLAERELSSRESQRETYTDDMPRPSQLDPEKASQLGDFLFQHKKHWQAAQGQQIIAKNSVVKGFYDFLVPDLVTEKDFWERYQWRCDKDRIRKDYEALPREELEKLISQESEHQEEEKKRVWALPGKKRSKVPPAEMIKSPTSEYVKIKPVYDRNLLLKHKVDPVIERTASKDQEDAKKPIYDRSRILKKTKSAEDPLQTSVVKDSSSNGANDGEDNKSLKEQNGLEGDITNNGQNETEAPLEVPVQAEAEKTANPVGGDATSDKEIPAQPEVASDGPEENLEANPIHAPSTPSTPSKATDDQSTANETVSSTIISNTDPLLEQQSEETAKSDTASDEKGETVILEEQEPLKDESAGDAPSVASDDEIPAWAKEVSGDLEDIAKGKMPASLLESPDVLEKAKVELGVQKADSFAEDIPEWANEVSVDIDAISRGEMPDSLLSSPEVKEEESILVSLGTLSPPKNLDETEFAKINVSSADSLPILEEGASNAPIANDEEVEVEEVVTENEVSGDEPVMHVIESVDASNAPTPSEDNADVEIASESQDATDQPKPSEDEVDVEITTESPDASDQPTPSEDEVNVEAVSKNDTQTEDEVNVEVASKNEDSGDQSEPNEDEVDLEKAIESEGVSDEPTPSEDEVNVKVVSKNEDVGDEIEPSENEVDGEKATEKDGADDELKASEDEGDVKVVSKNEDSGDQSEPSEDEVDGEKATEKDGADDELKASEDEGDVKVVSKNEDIGDEIEPSENEVDGEKATEKDGADDELKASEDEGDVKVVSKNEDVGDEIEPSEDEVDVEKATEKDGADDELKASEDEGDVKVVSKNEDIGDEIEPSEDEVDVEKATEKAGADDDLKAREDEGDVEISIESGGTSNEAKASENGVVIEVVTESEDDEIDEIKASKDEIGFDTATMKEADQSTVDVEVDAATMNEEPSEENKPNEDMADVEDVEEAKKIEVASDELTATANTMGDTVASKNEDVGEEIKSNQDEMDPKIPTLGVGSSEENKIAEDTVDAVEVTEEQKSLAAADSTSRMAAHGEDCTPPCVQVSLGDIPSKTKRRSTPEVRHKKRERVIATMMQLDATLQLLALRTCAAQ